MFSGSQNISGVGVRITEIEHMMPPLNDVLNGKFFLQNLPSIIATKVLNVMAKKQNIFFFNNFI